jgi:hypothetical protein
MTSTKELIFNSLGHLPNSDLRATPKNYYLGLTSLKNRKYVEKFNPIE